MNLEPKVKVIISLVIIVLVLGLWTTRHIYETNTCDPLWKNIERKLDYIKTPNSVRIIKLFKEYQDTVYKSNLVGDTIFITDISIIDSIRTMVNGKYLTKWNRPTDLWNVRMNMTLDNGEALDIRVSKIDGSHNPNMTHMYFGTDMCGDNGPSYSLTLGNYLERITEYKGVNY